MSESVFPALEHDALLHLEQVAVTAAGVDVERRVAVKAHPDPRKMILIDRCGDFEVIDKAPPPRNHKLLSCQEIVSYARIMLHEQPVVWIGGTGIIVTHDAERILAHKADYRFQRTAEFKYVQEAIAREAFSPKELLTLLRVKLARSFANEEMRLSLIKNVRSLRSVTDQKIGQGAGSFEAGLTSTANEKIEWPDSFTLSLSVFDDAAISAPQLVECVLDVDPMNANKPFAISPIVSDVTKAIQAVVDLAGEVIRKELAQNAIPVFLGEPNV